MLSKNVAEGHNLIKIIMEQVLLPAKIRDLSVKAKNLRKMNFIPAEFYGHGVQNMSLQLDYQTFRKLFKKAGYNTVITLEIDGNGEKSVLVHEVDRNPVTDLFSHVEFINVRMDEAVTTTVPVRLEGTAPAVRDGGGVLVQSLDEIEITCLPGDLIPEIVLNIELLTEINMGLHVSDVKLSDKIKILTDPEASIVMVAAPQEEEVAPVEAPTAADVEITTAKPEEGAEGAAAAPVAEAKEGKKAE